MRSKHVIMMLTVLVGIVWARAADARNGLLVVGGGAGERERVVVSRAIEDAVRTAGWSLPAKPFAKKDTDRLVTCPDVRSPWTCLAPSISAAGVEDVLIVSVETSQAANGAPVVVITGKLIVTTPPAFAVRKRFCEHCADDKLAEAGQDLTHQLIQELAARSGRTVVHIKSDPPGADINLDGTDVGATEATFNTFPGKHVAAVRKEGFVTEVREFTAEDGKTSELTLTLRPSAAVRTTAPTQHERPSRLVPFALIGVGGALVLSGGYFIHLGGQSDERYDYFHATSFGITAGVIGLGAVGAGLYLLWHRDSGPTITQTSSGAIVGWSGSF
jgi:PEGA domain